MWYGVSKNPPRWWQPWTPFRRVYIPQTQVCPRRHAVVELCGAVALRRTEELLCPPADDTGTVIRSSWWRVPQMLRHKRLPTPGICQPVSSSPRRPSRPYTATQWWTTIPDFNRSGLFAVAFSRLPFLKKYLCLTLPLKDLNFVDLRQHLLAS